MTAEEEDNHASKVKFEHIDPEEEEDRTNRGYEHRKDLVVRLLEYVIMYTMTLVSISLGSDSHCISSFELSNNNVVLIIVITARYQVSKGK